MFDKDNDGYVDVSKIGEIMRSLKLIPSEKEIELIKQDFLTLGMDKVSEMEFLKIITDYTRKDPLIDVVRDAFKVFSRDSNGFISVTELRHSLTNYGEKLTEKEIEDIIKEVDIYNDGMIDVEKFLDMMSLI